MESRVSPSATVMITPSTGGIVRTWPAWTDALELRLLAHQIVFTATPKRWAMPVSVSPARTVYFVRRPAPSAIEVSTAIGFSSVPSWRKGPRIAPAFGSGPVGGPPSCSAAIPASADAKTVLSGEAVLSSTVPAPSLPPAPAPANPAITRRGPGPLPSGPPTDPGDVVPGIQLANVATMTMRMTAAGSRASGPTGERIAPRRLKRPFEITRWPGAADLIEVPDAARRRGELLTGCTSSERDAADVVRCVGCMRPRTGCIPAGAF